jgi:hypothetical protein
LRTLRVAIAVSATGAGGDVTAVRRSARIRS